ncbi:MAG: cation:proton antiporter [Bacteroidota bacterium]
MDFTNPYVSIILVTAIIILSFLFNAFSERTNIPSVLLLIGTGVLLKFGFDSMGVPVADMMPVLEIFGIVGLIMIVLEAALDLELTAEKWPTIWKAFVSGLVVLLASTFAAAYLFYWLIDGMDFNHALLYATPISILSSAIIIPSVSKLSQDKKEFHIYESTFSDILGIMQFYFLLDLMKPKDPTAEPHFLEFSNPYLNFIVLSIATIIFSLIASYLLIFLFQNLKSQVKLFMLIAVLILLYAVGKLGHLSSLIIILIFGLVLSNSHLFFRGFLKPYLKKDVLHGIEHNFHIVTIETAFVVRTFFFVIFGMTLVLSSLLDVNVLMVSTAVLISIYLIRGIALSLLIGRAILPQLYIAPRGLVTVLLFFTIPENLQVETFNSGILLFVIIATSIIMAIALIAEGRKRSQRQAMEDDPLLIPPEKIYQGFQTKWLKEAKGGSTKQEGKMVSDGTEGS